MTEGEVFNMTETKKLGRKSHGAKQMESGDYSCRTGIRGVAEWIARN